MWLALGPGTFGNGTYTTDTTDTSPDGQWHHTTLSLLPFAGQVATGLVIGPGNSFGPVGPYDVWLANMAIQSANGSVHPLFTGGDVIGTIWGTCSNTNLTLAKESTAVDAMVGTTYYIDDHLGTASLELSSGGWPIWKGEFAPYGAELDTQATANHYKFTGKERDAESGLDYFGARYYGSAMGRWMSPDWSAKEEPIPYAKLDDPQSLNLYGYVGNNPLARVDADGHDYFWQKLGNALTGNGFRTHEQVNGHGSLQTALDHVGQTKWAPSRFNITEAHFFLPGQNKCNEFVADVLKESGYQTPSVPDGKGGMRLPTAGEMADPNLHIQGLGDARPVSDAKPGDVIAIAHDGGGGHSGFVTDDRQTVSASTNGTVVKNDYFFRSPHATPNNGENPSGIHSPPVVRSPIKVNP